MRALCLALVLITTTVGSVYAEQPIFDEMPRWSGGWGVQVLPEYRSRIYRTYESGRLEDTDQKLAFAHVQGVYTWHKSIRITAKLPIVLHSERLRGEPDGPAETTTDQGLGDPIIALPLKRYFNLDGRSGSWTLAPQFRIPLGTTHGYDRYGGAWAGALFAGYETETYDYIIGGNIGAWASTGKEPLAVHVHFGGGPNWRLGDFSGHIKLKADITAYDPGEIFFALAPVFYMRITDLVHIQLKSKHTVMALHPEKQSGRNDSFRIGIGFVY